MKEIPWNPIICDSFQIKEIQKGIEKYLELDNNSEIKSLSPKNIENTLINKVFKNNDYINFNPQVDYDNQ